MRNIKKLLALMLVMVMALGMVPMVATASDNEFTDADDIEFVEAADLLSALRVVQGYTDGSFQPKQAVTRAEAAAYIVRMLLTPEVAARLTNNSSSFTDFLSNPSAAWANGIIEYAVSQRIILGRGEGIFDPQASVTGIEMATFLLRALKVGAYDNPATWMLNAVADGTRFGILTTDVDYSANATREEVALYTFNSLLYGAEEVETDTVYKISVVHETNEDLFALNGRTFSTWFEAYSVGMSVDDAAYVAPGTELNVANKFTVTETKATETKGGLMEDVFGVTRVTGNPDDFGRPGVRTWMRNNRPIAEAYTMTPALVYTVAVTQAKLYADLGLTSNTPVNKATYYIDGWEQIEKADIDGTDSSSGGSFGANGIRTEVYRSATGAITIVELKTYVARIAGITPATAVVGERVTLAPLGTSYPGAGSGNFTNGGNTFLNSGFSIGDIVVYTASTADGTDFTVRSVTATEKVTMTPASLTPTSFVSDGQTFRYISKLGASVLAGSTALVETVFYLEANGFVVFHEAPDAVPNYAYVVRGNSAAQNQFGVTVPIVELLLADGTRITRNVVLANGSVDSTNYGNDGKDANDTSRFVTYRAGTAEGTVVLTAHGKSHVAKTDSDALALTAGRSSFTWDGTYYGNDNTIYFISRGNDRYNVYVGHTNVPSVAGSVAGAVIRESSTNNQAHVVFIEADSSTIIGAVRDFVFVSKTWDDPTTATGHTNQYYVAEVMVNGTMEDRFLSSIYAVGLWEQFSESNGITTLSSYASNNTDERSIRYANGVVTLGGASHVPSSSLEVFRYNTATGGITGPFTVSALPTVAQDFVCSYQVNASTNQLTRIFLDVTPTKYDITIPAIGAGTGQIPANSVTGVTITGITSSLETASAGQTVTITIAMGSGIDTNTDTASPTSLVLTLSNDTTMRFARPNVLTVSSNSATAVITFSMPSQNVTVTKVEGAFA